MVKVTGSKKPGPFIAGQSLRAILVIGRLRQVAPNGMAARIFLTFLTTAGLFYVNIGVSIKLVKIEEHYSQLLGIRVPWEIGKVDLDMSAHSVDIEIEYTGVTDACPECGANCPKHDDRKLRS